MFQKNLVVWKPLYIDEEREAAEYVSEELSSVETPELELAMYAVGVCFRRT